MIKMNLLTEQKQTLRMSLWLRVGGGERELREEHVHTAIFKMDNQQRPTVQHIKLYSRLCSSLDGRGV